MRGNGTQNKVAQIPMHEIQGQPTDTCRSSSVVRRPHQIEPLPFKSHISPVSLPHAFTPALYLSTSPLCDRTAAAATAVAAPLSPLYDPLPPLSFPLSSRDRTEHPLHLLLSVRRHRSDLPLSVFFVRPNSSPARLHLRPKAAASFPLCDCSKPATPAPNSPRLFTVGRSRSQPSRPASSATSLLRRQQPESLPATCSTRTTPTPAHLFCSTPSSPPSLLDLSVSTTPTAANSSNSHHTKPTISTPYKTLPLLLPLHNTKPSSKLLHSSVLHQQQPYLPPNQIQPP